jgi:hypothetical protein
LRNILDLTVLVGFICHPTKLKPPAQIQKFCGFLYNSVGTLKSRFPDNKIVRALSLLEFLMRGSRTVICRLGLDVVVGTSQYLVPATPHAIGASFLHHVYGIFITRPWKILMIFMISITQDWPWGLKPKQISAGGNKL